MILGLFIISLTILVIGLTILHYGCYIFVSSINLEGAMFSLILAYIGVPLTDIGFVLSLMFGLLHFFGR